MVQVSSDGSGGLDPLNTQSMLVNLELYRGALDKCNRTIELYNATVPK